MSEQVRENPTLAEPRTSTEVRFGFGSGSESVLNPTPATLVLTSDAAVPRREFADAAKYPSPFGCTTVVHDAPDEQWGERADDRALNKNAIDTIAAHRYSAERPRLLIKIVHSTFPSILSYSFTYPGNSAGRRTATSMSQRRHRSDSTGFLSAAEIGPATVPRRIAGKCAHLQESKTAERDPNSETTANST
ncbi:hypothetical protein B0H16DRAFT_1468354 [Mycena metata]|uniref:Uncharacterized protein n=1 Tax=Mycena metata TaxID=1033252 RepID=A0AAD7I1B4_9AGAR|nr:hypothetical protein B0H16DRAFT_1468354 [Mycena metata]